MLSTTSGFLCGFWGPNPGHKACKKMPLTLLSYLPALEGGSYMNPLLQHLPGPGVQQLLTCPVSPQLLFPPRQTWVLMDAACFIRTKLPPGSLPAIPTAWVIKIGHSCGEFRFMKPCRIFLWIFFKSSGQDI